MAIKSFSRATETEYMCPLCSETAIRWLGEPAPICEECGVEMEFFDGPDGRTGRAELMLGDDWEDGWEKDF